MRKTFCVKSSAKTGLNGLSVIVTRPVEQAGELAALIERSGGRTLIFPTIEIGSRRFTDLMSGQVQGLKSADWVIFISIYAVRFGLQCARLAGVSLDKMRIASIGAATTQALIHAGESVTLECPPPPGSESLLSTPEMGNVRGKTMFIIRGTGGRELLGSTLRKRGAEVEYVECYERRCPEVPVDPILKTFDHERAVVIVTTSVYGLENLIKMLRRHSHENLMDSRLVVAGDRQLREARRMGWRGAVAAARDAGNIAILEKLSELTAA